MDYHFKLIEEKWQTRWENSQIYKVTENSDKPKYYVLDMFPYPSGAGLHVGHPLGYIASDIYTRYKRLKGFNVLHPMGFDAFGLPAEQYAVQTGQHPADTTEENIQQYISQLKKIGLSFDWSREIRTSDPKYYKWTQWVFVKLFNHFYNNKTQKAESIESLISEFETNGNMNIDAACDKVPQFEAAVWVGFEEDEKQDVLMNYRLAYRAAGTVNWCPELGTVLANDEVKEGFSERGGHPVIQKKMEQWQLRITAYAERLLQSLNTLEWSDSMKEIQRNWIGRSEGAEMLFPVKDSETKIKVFTTRPDTIFGSTFMVIAPEHPLVGEFTTMAQVEDIDNYVAQTAKRSERDRIADAKNITGVFTGTYAMNPFSGEEIPVWISDYVLAGYGTGAIMAVPAHDSRDYAFAKHFGLPILQVISGGDIAEESYDAKEGKLINSGFLNGLESKEAITAVNNVIEEKGLGVRKINFRLRDASFSRQRYWGEPFPVYYKNDTPFTLPEENLPLELPKITNFKPTEDGDPPLGRAENWHTAEGSPFELSTMPGFAGSSAYYLRYMSPNCDDALVSPEANAYWQDVDLYIGGTEHAVGHLLYARFWNKFMFDLGYVVKDEPFRKLVNQGMIQGRSNYVYRVKNMNTFVSKGRLKEFDTMPLHVDVNIVENDILDIDKFKKWRPDFADADFILDTDGKYHCGHAVEKMSKSMYNVVNPDDIIERYGSDTLRMYEMFLGPIDQAKPWDTSGIEGVHRFLRKLWRLAYDETGKSKLTDEKASKEELKVLHKTIKKIGSDIERFSFNTSVAEFMICVNELTSLKCSKKAIFEPLAIILSPFAPHAAEELWESLGKQGSINDATFPDFEEKFLKEDSVKYPVAFNGKTRFTLELSAELNKDEIEKTVLADEQTIAKLEGKQVRKVIVVPGRMVNIVVG